mmetsp:Transcript_24453/g.36279  ORF Transcript_24453/g.36279 Transcript_24453/m.36279 type:complete len:620 (-) Transcript_24453:169-2028(-)
MFWSPKKEDNSIPPGLEALLPSLTDAQADLCKILCLELGQPHLFRHWGKSEKDVSPAVKRRFIEQLEALDEAHPTGLHGYITNAKTLLAASRKGENPLDGWKPSVPVGATFELGSEEYNRVERIGRHELGAVGFVLVAGGLGERLGYPDIKVGLPTEQVTEKCYLQFYCEYILALQKGYAAGKTFLPLCIMTSKDTNKKTMKLLEKNNYFGLKKAQVSIVQQGNGVPALMDNDAKIALDPEDEYRVMTKPHGHGDVHALLFEHGIIRKWVEKGINWVTFFQDTNGLGFHTLPLALGVSVEKNLIMNSLAIPRKAKQAVGAIAKLTNEETGETRTINVEYNQLDPLLRSSGFDDGDVNDPETGFSPFPGNINQLLFSAEEYADALEECEGVMPEFVNPKYKDAAKTKFKKPTRLECMMQDFPTVLKGENAERVGFTSIAADMCFSPVKNATSDGMKLQKKGTHPACAASGEADQYGAVRNILRSMGVTVEDREPETFNGVSAVFGPEIVVAPESMCCPAEFREVFTSPRNVKISSRSSLVIKGPGKLTIESLDLDGALVINCEIGANAVVRKLKVKNDGWKRVAVEDTDDVLLAMKGYRLEKIKSLDLNYRKNEEGCKIL